MDRLDHIPLCAPNLSGNEAAYLNQCIQTGYVSSIGPFVDQLEARVAAAAGAKRAVATSAGTTGLHVALVALGIRPGDLVILPTLSFIAAANAIHQCHAAPWLFDVEARRFGLDPDLLAQELARHTRKDGMILRHTPSGRRVAAILPVHVLGRLADMPRLVAVARDYDLPIIADAAAALGATREGRPIGALGAELSVVSLNGNKTVTAGGGGVVLGDNERLMELVRHLSTTARLGPDYDHDRPAFNYRMTNLQAAVGCAQMERLDAFVEAKRRIQKTYEAALAPISELQPLPSLKSEQNGCWLSAMILKDGTQDSIKALDAYLSERRIEARPFWKPIHLQLPYGDCPRTKMPIGEKLWYKLLTLPCSTHLSRQDQESVVTTLKEYFS